MVGANICVTELQALQGERIPRIAASRRNRSRVVEPAGEYLARRMEEGMNNNKKMAIANLLLLFGGIGLLVIGANWQVAVGAAALAMYARDDV